MINRYNRYLIKENFGKASAYAAKALMLVKEKISFKNLLKLLGKDNYYIYSQIKGFGSGDENGDRPVISSSLGEFGSRKILGPIRHAISKMGINDGEFFVEKLFGGIL